LNRLGVRDQLVQDLLTNFNCMETISNNLCVTQPHKNSFRGFLTISLVGFLLFLWSLQVGFVC